MTKLGLFKALGLGFILLLAGCADLRDQSPLQVSTCESLNMKLDYTTKDEAINILQSYGYSVKNKPFHEQKQTQKNSPFTGDALRILNDFAKGHSILEVRVSEDQCMEFLFDKDQKLIGFSVQGNRNVLDPLIAKDNAVREQLYNVSSDRFSKAKRKKIADLIYKHWTTKITDMKVAKLKNRETMTTGKTGTKPKKGSKKRNDNWDINVYLGKDFSISTSIHADVLKDFSFYGIMSRGAIYQTILTVRDMIMNITNFVANLSTKR